MDDDPIRVRAKSLSGSEAILIGYVKDRESVPFHDAESARRRVEGIGWTNVAIAINRRWDAERNQWRVSWDDQKVTFNDEGSYEFKYK